MDRDPSTAASRPVAPGGPSAPTDARWYSNLVTKGRALTLAGVMATGALAYGIDQWVTSDSHAAAAPLTPAPGVKDNPACDTINLTHVATTYNTGNFLPTQKGGAGSKTPQSQVDSDYVQSFFSQGPLGGSNADASSMAAVWAAVVEPAIYPKGASTSYSSKAEYDNELSRLENPALEPAEAKAVCNDEANVLGRTISTDTMLSNQFIAPTKNYIEFQSVNNGPSKDMSLTLNQRNNTTGHFIGGIVFSPVQDGAQPTLNAFENTLLQRDGELDQTGTLKLSGTGNAKEGGSQNTSTTSTTNKGASAAEQKGQGGGSTQSQVGNGRTSGNQGTGTNGITSGGNKPEGAPGGTEQTPSQGPAGTTPAPTAPAGTTPPETAPPQTAPPATSPPQTAPPTTAPTPTTSPTTAPQQTTTTAPYKQPTPTTVPAWGGN